MNIKRLRDMTYNDMVNKLKEYGKCALIRPTGFGKTGLLTRLLKQYNNVLFLYPADVVKDAVLNFYYNGKPESDSIENTMFMTYYKLINLTKRDMRKLGDIDLIICDECHKLGAARTYKSMKKLLEVFPNAHLIGATATPERMDLVDEIVDFFDEHTVFPYTLHDAFKDGILKKPYYCFCSYGVKDIENVEKETRLEIEKLDAEDRLNSEILLRSHLIEISNLQRMDLIISETCHEKLEDDSYLKFIIFFSDFEHMNSKGDSVSDWFHDAYPDYTIDILKVSSEKDEYSKNVSKLSSLCYKNHHIDLIYCVDMMNMGYHVDDLTGILMYRGTQSGIIFSQQLGRVLSSGSSKSGIVFDVVDNIHREAMYDVLGRVSKETKKKMNRIKTLQKKQEKLHEVGQELCNEELVELDSLLNSTSSRRWWTHANDLMPEDLIATGHEATYRELIAKTVAEPVSMRCRQAYKRWKERGGSDNPFTREHILSQKAPTAVPLSPFCELKSVSVNAVLREIGL